MNIVFSGFFFRSLSFMERYFVWRIQQNDGKRELCNRFLVDLLESKDSDLIEYSTTLYFDAIKGQFMLIETLEKVISKWRIT